MRGNYRFPNRVVTVVALLLVGQGLGLREGCVHFKEHGQQQVLGGNNYYCTFKDRTDKTNGIMGYGGALTLVNGSPFDWTLSGQSSYQMDTWKWPRVAAGVLERFSGCYAAMLILDRKGS